MTRIENYTQESQYEPSGFPYEKYESQEETINKFYKIDEIRELFKNIADLSYDKLAELKNLIIELSNYYSIKHNLMLYYPIPNPFVGWENEVEEQMKKYHIWFYDNIITFSEQQNVNGYKLYNINNNIMQIDMFLEHVDLWQNNEQMTKEEFEKEFYDTICTDWYRFNRNGKCFEGFWSYPDGSPEKDNAWELTGDDNMNGLFDLPYPKKFVLATIKMGCN